MAKSLPQVKARDYEVRRLDDAGEALAAVWLHASADDIFIPLPPTFGRFEAYRPYSERQMLSVLEKEAKQDIAGWAPLDKQTGRGAPANHP